MIAIACTMRGKLRAGLSAIQSMHETMARTARPVKCHGGVMLAVFPP